MDEYRSTPEVWQLNSGDAITTETKVQTVFNFQAKAERGINKQKIRLLFIVNGIQLVLLPLNRNGKSVAVTVDVHIYTQTAKNTESARNESKFTAR